LPVVIVGAALGGIAAAIEGVETFAGHSFQSAEYDHAAPAALADA
jgi:hypothetical protein